MLGSFDELADGRPPGTAQERTAFRLASQVGAAAVPALGRKLAEDGDAGRWAYRLLLHLAADGEALRQRIGAVARELAESAGHDDAARLRAMALLTELAIPAPSAPLRDPAASRARSLRELADCLDGPADVARAADFLAVELEGPELTGFTADLVSSEPESARALLDELLLRDDLDLEDRAALERQVAELGAVETRRPAAPPRRRAGFRLGRHRDGRLVVLVTRHSEGSAPARFRALAVLLLPSGRLGDAQHLDEVSRSRIDRELTRPIRAAGFALERCSRARAHDLLLAAARASRRDGVPWPGAFYLGRDLAGITDAELRRGELAQQRTALLARGVDLLAAGDAAAARVPLARYVLLSPDDPDGASELGRCLLELGDVAGARRHLARAAYLAPHDPDHHWNHAAAAHRAGHRGGCYLALREYLRCGDSDEQRCELARRFVDEYERLALLHHPELSPAAVARRARTPQRRRAASRPARAE